MSFDEYNTLFKSVCNQFAASNQTWKEAKELPRMRELEPQLTARLEAVFNSQFELGSPYHKAVRELIIAGGEPAKFLADMEKAISNDKALQNQLNKP